MDMAARIQNLVKDNDSGSDGSDDEDNDEYSSPILKYLRGLAHNISYGSLSLILDKFLDENFFDGFFFDDIFGWDKREFGCRHFSIVERILSGARGGVFQIFGDGGG